MQEIEACYRVIVKVRSAVSWSLLRLSVVIVAVTSGNCSGENTTASNDAAATPDGAPNDDAQDGVSSCDPVQGGFCPGGLRCVTNVGTLTGTCREPCPCIAAGYQCCAISDHDSACLPVAAGQTCR